MLQRCLDVDESSENEIHMVPDCFKDQGDQEAKMQHLSTKESTWETEESGAEG